MRATVILLPLLLLLLIVLVGAAVRPRPVPARRPGPRLATVQRRSGRWRWGGVAFGLVLVIGSVLLGGALGRGLLLAAPLFALGVAAGVIVGELRVAAPVGPARSAALEVRRIRDYLPRRLVGAVVVAAGTLGVLLVATTALGSPDDLGRAGRWLVTVCSESITEARGPWPGSFYSVPLVILVLGGIAATGWALRQVVRRPRQGEDIVIDDLLRRRACSAIVAASGILVAVPLVGVSVIASVGLLGVTCPSWWMAALGWVLVGVVAPLAATLAVWSVAVLAMPMRLGAGNLVR